MTGGFIASWPYVGEEIFRRLAELDDEPVSSDVFADIARTLADKLGRRLARSLDDRAESFAAFRAPIDELQDEQHIHRALEVLEAIVLPDFAIEADILNALESVHELLSDEYSPDLAKAFADLVAAFIRKFNLAYKLRPPFRLLPLISGQAARIYDNIQQCTGPYGDHPELWEAFEEAYHHFVRNNGDRKTPIHKITSYLEAVAADHLSIKRDSLGDLLKIYEEKALFPHKGTIKTSLSTLYGFTSDFPGIRHPGNPAARNRELREDDTLMLSFLLFVWSGYLHTLPVGSEA